jgi:sigma-B regulation protein RsbU (phosphoserine phosphatase)
MTAVEQLLELAARHPREGGMPLPDAVLGQVLRETGAVAGALKHGDETLAHSGPGAGTVQRYPLPGGRDEFWLEVVGGSEPESSLCLAAGLVLSIWVVREELKKARFAERRRMWEVESLRAIGEALGGTLDSVRIAEELLLHVTAMLDARRGEIWLVENGGVQPLARVNGAGGITRCADGSCFVAARVGGAVLAAEEVLALPDEGLLEPARLAVPVLGRRGRLGAIAIAEREVRGGTAPFASTDTETLSLYASQAAIALENAVLHQESIERARMDREMELAAAVQRQLLPTSFPVPPGFELAARSEPARHVGGDLYDIIPCARGFHFMIADVAGKGVPAALMASSLHAAVRLLSRESPGLPELFQQLHAHLLSSMLENKFATVFLGCLRDNGELEYVSAGHNPAVLVQPDGSVELLRASGPPLGLLADVRFQSVKVSLAPDSLLVAYTDGFSEAPSPSDDDDFGVGRIVDLAITHRRDPLGRVVAELFAAVDRHTGGAPAHDDRTLLLLRRLFV